MIFTSTYKDAGVDIELKESLIPMFRKIARGTKGARVLWPVHPNPEVGVAAREVLGGDPRVELAPPLGYVDLADALASCKLVLTDR